MLSLACNAWLAADMKRLGSMLYQQSYRKQLDELASRLASR